jgi:hypothetical protein
VALGFGAALVDCRQVRLGRLGGPVKTAEQVGADGGQQVVAGQLSAGGQIVGDSQARRGTVGHPCRDGAVPRAVDFRWRSGPWLLYGLGCALLS